MSAERLPSAPHSEDAPDPLPGRPAPGPREMALVAGMAFFLTVFTAAPLALVGVGPGWVLSQFVVSQVLFIALPAILAVRWFYLDAASVLPRPRVPGRAMIGTLGGALALNHLLTLYGAWQESVFPTPESFALLDRLLVYRGPIDFLLLLTALSIVPGVCEEILFRGYLQAGLTHHLGGRLAGIAVSALLFALFHLDPWRFVGVAGLGLYLAWLRAETGSLLPAMAAHALSNALSVVLKVSGRFDGDAPAGSSLTACVAAAALLASITLVRASRTPGERVV
ncbi:MAG TPA: type II CAAX endopeptidase family protein [Candidatus Polarisedimenticolia bacterium]|nr:type II CAAX endopeptidase family protein [Candidatus Polarisedimenticolia bacterium]